MVFKENVGDAQFVGASNFKRNKPEKSPTEGKFNVERFHHLHFEVGDVATISKIFSMGLGMKIVEKSDQETGNHEFSSVVMKSNDIVFVLSAPYAEDVPTPKETNKPLPNYSKAKAHEFFRKHGLAVTAVGILVDDVKAAYEYAVSKGAIKEMEPTDLGKGVTIAEVRMYLKGDVVLRFINDSKEYKGAFVPGYENIEEDTPDVDYGLARIDHVVGNCADAMEAYAYFNQILGFYKFAEFIAEDVGTKDSGLNSVVCSSHNEMVLLPLNEPTFGTNKMSQIQAYIDHNRGPGVQHIALLTPNIFETIKSMRASNCFDFQKKPYDHYYSVHVPKKMGNLITKEQLELCKEHAILIDKEGEGKDGVLFQIFTKTLGDRPTVFIEIIQRNGCINTLTKMQAAGCGGFGRGNFGALFKTVEDDFTKRGVDQVNE
mmetsp:Transcript_6946/g.10163  ORF Transcript_6946/g.10163 Transcript_6946/m.10163 type:complete len:430 (-) Transcript_6946:35-1324(-)